MWTNLRRANEARDIEWTSSAVIKDHTWRGCELGGEYGEALTEIIAPDMWEHRHTKLAPELADVVICIDLTSMTLGLPEIPIFAAGSISVVGLDRDAYKTGHQVLLLQNLLKKAERERRGWPGSRPDMEEVERRLRNLMGRIGLYANYCGIDLPSAVVEKFNETSRKVGLTTFLSGLE